MFRWTHKCNLLLSEAWNISISICDKFHNNMHVFPLKTDVSKIKMEINVFFHEWCRFHSSSKLSHSLVSTLVAHVMFLWKFSIVLSKQVGYILWKPTSSGFMYSHQSEHVNKTPISPMKHDTYFELGKSFLLGVNTWFNVFPSLYFSFKNVV